MANTTPAMVAANVWTARAIPIILFGMVGYATYVVIGPLSINYLLAKHNDTTAVIPILITYFLLLILMVVSFIRLLHLTLAEPPYVPLGPAAIRDRELAKRNKRHSRIQEQKNGIGGREYNTGSQEQSHAVGSGVNSSGQKQEDVVRNGEYGTDGASLDAPGLEMFYTKDVFVAEMDGKPKWCTHCGNWKPDRTHHCSSSGRCIKRMDHFCPWVGGPIGENNFKFFIQFTGYCGLYCIQICVVMAVFVHRQRTSSDGTLNPHLIVTLSLSALFGIFAVGMTATSVELAIRNQTQVERLGAETRVHILAVIKPESGTFPSADGASQPILPCPEITYPLGAGTLPFNGSSSFAKQTQRGLQIEQASSQNVKLAEPNSQQNTAPGILLSPKMDNRSTHHSLAPSRDPSDVSTIVAAPEHQQLPGNSSTPVPKWPSKEIAERDLKANRTFVILKMPEPGHNPWDLGSSLLNWETVMGYSVLDWFLPLKRSPCSDHEEAESYYQIGPMVDLLRSKHGLLPESEIRAYGGRRRTERRDPEDSFDATTSADLETGRRGGHRKRRKRRSDTSKRKESSAAGEAVEMQDRAGRI